MNVNYVAPFLDHSGYGEASRHAIVALSLAGVGLKTEIVSFSPDRFNVGQGAELAEVMQDSGNKCNVRIMQMTPENYLKQLVPGMKHIGHLYWEVLGVDPVWVWHMNKVDQLWVPSHIFADNFKKCGVRSKIWVLPQAMDVDDIDHRPYQIKHHNGYLFYSIFQWTERKNPRLLLESYWKTFEGHDDVGLLIKTYRANFSKSEKQAIINDVKRWKMELGLKSYAPIYLYLDGMDHTEMMRLHATGDCFVSAHRGEGWGYPQMEAMAMGKPVISTCFGGIHEFIYPDEYFPVSYKLTKVFGMNHIPWYNDKQEWATADGMDLSNQMWNAYIDQNAAREVGKRGRKRVRESFNYQVVGARMKELLNLI